MRASVEEGAEEMYCDDVDLFEDISPGLTQPLLSCDIWKVGRGRREGKMEGERERIRKTSVLNLPIYMYMYNVYFYKQQTHHLTI